MNSSDRDHGGSFDAARSGRVLLVTGFGPFDGHDRNPSGDAAERLDGMIIEGVRVAGLRVPVSWRRAFPAIEAAVDEHRPFGLVALGVAPNSFLRLEVVAKNACLPDRDADGERPELGSMHRIIEDAPPAYFTTLPVDELEADLQSLGAPDPGRSGGSGVPAARFTDAGSYLCNHVFFLMMHRLQGKVPFRGFIHVPPYRTEALPSGVDTHELHAAIKTMIHRLVLLLDSRARA